MRNPMNNNNKTFLTGHDSPETAYIIESYPYGRLRTQMKVWIETNKKGDQREVKQTLNPKTQRWNAPKKSTYSNLILLYIDHAEKDYLKSYHLSYNYSSVTEIKEIHDFLINNNIEISEIQKKTMRSAVMQLSISKINWSYREYTPESLIKAKDILKANIKLYSVNDFNTLFNGIEPSPPADVPESEQKSYFKSTVYKGISNIMNGTPEPSTEPQETENEILIKEIMNGDINTLEELRARRNPAEQITDTQPEPAEAPAEETATAPQDVQEVKDLTELKLF